MMISSTGEGSVGIGMRRLRDAPPPPESLLDDEDVFGRREDGAGRAGALFAVPRRLDDEFALPFDFAVGRLDDAISTAPARAGYRGVGKRRARRARRLQPCR
jgi:hypothetical protein